MNRYLSHKYFLLSNVIYDECIPFDILKLIMLMISDHTVYVFNRIEDVIIITNRGLYYEGNQIFGTYNDLTFINLDRYINLDIYNIKKIDFMSKILYILYDNGSLFTYHHTTKKLIHILDDIESISSCQYYGCFINKNKELYIQGEVVPILSDCQNEGRLLKTKFLTVKDVVCHPSDITILFDDGRIIYYNDYYQLLDLPFIDQISVTRGHIFGVDKNIIYRYELYNDDRDESNSDSDSDSDSNESINHDGWIFNRFGNNIKMIGHCMEFIFILDISGELYLYKTDPQTNLEIDKMTKLDLPCIESIHCSSYSMIAVTINGDLYRWQIWLKDRSALIKISL